MIYTIEIPPEDKEVLHGKVVVDIEFWLNDHKAADGTYKWYTECRTRIIPEGIVPLSRSVDDPDEFIRDLSHLMEYRVWLNEVCETHNNIQPLDQAEERHRKYHHPELLRRIKDFCKKYNLFYMED